MSILFEYVNGINTSEVHNNMYLLDEYFTQIDNKDGIKDYDEHNKGQIYLIKKIKLQILTLNCRLKIICKSFLKLKLRV